MNSIIFYFAFVPDVYLQIKPKLNFFKTLSLYFKQLKIKKYNGVH